MEYSSKPKGLVRKAQDRYFSDGLHGFLENVGNDVRYVILPVAVGAFFKAYGDVPDNMITESLRDPAIAFGVGEMMRTVGYIDREARNNALTPLKAAGALVRAVAPYWLAVNVWNGSEGAGQAIADTFIPIATWGAAHVTGTEKKQS